VTRRRTEVVEFATEDPSACVAWMDRLAAARDGWINLHPGVRPEDEPPPHSSLSVLLAGVTHDVPVATWVAGKPVRGETSREQVGIQHAGGKRVLAELASAGAGLPDGWRMVQDHPRRGLIVAPAPDAPHDDVLGWILEAATVLSTVRLSGDWRADVFLPTA
jgi:hypothetical protein